MGFQDIGLTSDMRDSMHNRTHKFQSLLTQREWQEQRLERGIHSVYHETCKTFVQGA